MIKPGTIVELVENERGPSKLGGYKFHRDELDSAGEFQYLKPNTIGLFIDRFSKNFGIILIDSDLWIINNCYSKILTYERWSARKNCR